MNRLATVLFMFLIGGACLYGGTIEDWLEVDSGINVLKPSEMETLVREALVMMQEEETVKKATGDELRQDIENYLVKAEQRLEEKLLKDFSLREARIAVDVKDELQGEMKSDLKTQLLEAKRTLKASMRNNFQLEDELREELRSELSDELRKQLRVGLLQAERKLAENSEENTRIQSGEIIAELKNEFETDLDERLEKLVRDVERRMGQKTEEMVMLAHKDYRRDLDDYSRDLDEKLRRVREKLERRMEENEIEVAELGAGRMGRITRDILLSSGNDVYEIVEEIRVRPVVSPYSEKSARLRLPSN